MLNACEMAVVNMGHSYRSDTIWKEYISFINSWPEESEKDKSPNRKLSITCTNVS